MPALTDGLGSVVEQHARGGRVFLSCSGLISVGLGQSLKATIGNPAGSGKRLFVFRLVYYSTSGPVYGALRVNPDANLPTTAKTVDNALVGGAAGVALVKADAGSAMSGGTDTGIVLPVDASERLISELPPLIIPAGVTLGLNAAFTGITGDFVLTLFWWEE